MIIKKVLLHQTHEWIDYNDNDFEIKIFKPLKYARKALLHLVYKNMYTCDKLIYECDNCKKQITTSWIKFKVQHYEKNRYLCNKCINSIEEVRKNISQGTKKAMAREDIKEKHSQAQRARFQRPEEIEKSKQRAKEIMSRPGMKELISQRTKEAMALLPREYICSTKNMTPEQIIDYRKRIAKSISENYSELTKQKMLASKHKRYSHNIEEQNKYIEKVRYRISNNKSKPQEMVASFLKQKYDIDEEYPINVWDDERFNKRFFLSDIHIKNSNILIEVLGNYWHKAFIDYLEGRKTEYTIESILRHYHNDLLRDNAYQLLGYQVIYIKESDLKNNDWQDYLIKEIERLKNLL